MENWMHVLSTAAGEIGKIIGGALALTFVAYFKRVVHFFRDVTSASQKMHKIFPHFDDLQPATYLPGKIDRNITLTAETHEIATLANVRLDVMSRLGQELKFEASPDGQWKQISDSFREQFGYDHDEMVGLGWKSILYRDDRADFVREWEYARKDNRLFEAAVRFVARDGTIYRVSVVISPEPPRNPKRMYGRVDVIQIDRDSPADRARFNDPTPGPMRRPL